MSKKSDEILILRRSSGYLRLHIPPLIYDAKASHLIREGLSQVEGVRKVEIAKETGKVSIHYDQLVVKENALLLIIDGISTKLLKKDSQDIYEKTLKSVEEARVRQAAYVALNGVIIVYLVKVHWMLIKHHWLRKPLKNWLPITMIATIVYLHKRQLSWLWQVGKKDA